MDQTTQSFVQGRLGTDSFICDRDKALEEIKNINTIINDLRGYIASDLQNDFAAFHDIKGFIGDTQYKEDNLFYEISIANVTEETGNGEKYDDVFIGYPDAIANTLEAIANKIQDHVDAYDYYSNRTQFPNFIKEIMGKLKGKNDVELTLDDLTTCTREELLAKYGLTAEDLARNPDELEFASDEEKNNYLEALEYFNQEFSEDQKHYSVGKAEDMAKKLALSEVTAEPQTTVNTGENPGTLDTTGDATKQRTQSSGGTGGTTAPISSSKSSGEVNVGSASASMEGPKYASSQGNVSYRRSSSTPIPATSNVSESSISEHKAEMQEATDKAKNTTAFDERNAYEEKVAAEQKTQDDANRAQAAKDEADHAAKVAEQTKTTEQTKAETTTTTQPTTSTNNVTEDFTQAVAQPQQATTTSNVQQAEVAMPQNVNTNAASTSTTSTVAPEIKDMISNGKSAVEAVASKADPSKMVSSVTSNSTPLKPIKIDNAKSTTAETSTAGKFVPPIAGVSAAAVAGIGAKLYVDKKDDKKEKKEEKHENKFFNENIEPEEESKLNFSSKEDIIRLLDR